MNECIKTKSKDYRIKTKRVTETKSMCMHTCVSAWKNVSLDRFAEYSHPCQDAARRSILFGDRMTPPRLNCAIWWVDQSTPPQYRYLAPVKWVSWRLFPVLLWHSFEPLHDVPLSHSMTVLLEYSIAFPLRHSEIVLLEYSNPFLFGPSVPSHSFVWA